jgi:hypothetical protein
MRKLLTALLATAALGAAPVAEVRAQTAQDTLGRALEGLQGGQDQRRDDRSYRDDDRRRDDRGYAPLEPHATRVCGHEGRATPSSGIAGGPTECGCC